MLKTFNCPTCGGPLEFEGSEASIRCRHCGNSVLVPDEYRPNPASPPAQGGSLADLLAQAGQLGEMARLIQAGQKIEAIKLYRQLTGLGLKESKEAVEALAAGRSVTFTQVAAPETAARGPLDLVEIQRLVAAGRKIEAIKLYRQATGLGLKEAKDAVEALEAGADADAAPAAPRVALADGFQDADAAAKLLEVRNRLAAGDREGALQLFRAHFGASLEDARGALDAMEHAQPVPSRLLRPRPAPPRPNPRTRPASGGGWRVVVSAVLGLGLCILASAAGPLMASGAFWQAADLATHDPAVSDRLGAPVNVVWWRLAWGSIRCSSTCSSNFSFIVAGPRGEARVQVLSDSSGGFPILADGEWTPDLVYHFDDGTSPGTGALLATPRPVAPTLSLAELDATAGARARATRAAESTATAIAQARRDATATVAAQETRAAAATAAEIAATSQALVAAQAGWQTTLISETFSSNRNFWTVDPLDDDSLRLEPAVADGVYRWNVRPASGGHYFNILPGAIKPVTDFVASVDVRLTGGERGVYAYGLAFRAEGRDYGLFSLTNEGQARLYGVFDSAIYTLIDFNSAAIHPEPGAVNRLTVRALGPDFVFEINGQVVYTWNEPDLNDGRVGLGVDIGREGADAVIEFDNLEVVAP